jgi:hypothetical protein
MSASKRGTGPVGNALGPSLGPNRCDISDYHLQSFNQPIQHSRPACSKRNSHERLLALALGVKMVVCLGPLLVLASVIVIACYSAATNDVLNAVLPDTSLTGRTQSRAVAAVPAILAVRHLRQLLRVGAFDRGNRIWFFLLSASFGLHFPARYCVRL